MSDSTNARNLIRIFTLHVMAVMRTSGLPALSPVQTDNIKEIETQTKMPRLISREENVLVQRTLVSWTHFSGFVQGRGDPGQPGVVLLGIMQWSLL